MYKQNGCKWISVITLLSIATALPAEVVDLDYGVFQIALDCDRRGAVQFQYTTVPDTGNNDRSSTFFIDSDVEARCQQTSTSTYTGTTIPYQRGHLVPANHFDHDPNLIRQTNVITNVLPQTRTLNNGAWKRTEMIIECLRDTETLTVIGGVIWGSDTNDDHFVSTHGVTTPSAYWKVIVMGESAIGWIMPNNEEARWSRLDDYIVAPTVIESVIDRTLNIQEELKSHRPWRSWGIRGGCNRG